MEPPLKRFALNSITLPASNYEVIQLDLANDRRYVASQKTIEKLRSASIQIH